MSGDDEPSSKGLTEAVEAWKRFFGPQPNLVVDAGSRDGNDARYLRDAITYRPHPSRRWRPDVVCIEARPEAADQIKRDHPEFVVFDVAVGAYEHEAEFLEFETEDQNLAGAASLNLSREQTYGHTGARTRPVRVMRLDKLLSGHRGQIDILKIDVEGYALQTLFGLGRRIEDVLVAHVETETVDRAAWREPMTNVHVADYMRSHGFRLLAVDYPWGSSIEDQVWVNCATRPDVHDYFQAHPEPRLYQ